MTSIETSPTDIRLPEGDVIIDDAQLAAVAFLARYSGRTLDAYRHDLRGFFQWASDNNLDVLAATRPHIELWARPACGPRSSRAGRVRAARRRSTRARAGRARRSKPPPQFGIWDRAMVGGCFAAP